MEVAKRLNISAVADDMYVSQAALSKMIKRLEESLGTVLFERSNRGLTLTQEGEYLYNHIKYPFQSINQAFQDLRDMKAANKKRLVIGLPTAFDRNKDYIKVKQFIDRFEKKHPDVEFEENMYDFIEMCQALLCGNVDVAFIHSFILSEITRVNYKTVCCCRSMLAMSSANKLAKKSCILPEDMSDETFYVLPMNSNITPEEYGKLYIEPMGYRPKKVVFTSNMSTLLRAVKSNKGVALCGFLTDPNTDSEIKYYNISQGNISELYVAWREGGLSDIAARFVNSFPSDIEKLTGFDPSSIVKPGQAE
jgi:DNA-binding transcriptional LysR family regulator